MLCKRQPRPLQYYGLFVPSIMILDSLTEVEILTCDTKIPHSIVWHKINHQLRLFILLLGIQLPQPIQPHQLEDLLWKEESRYKVRLR